MYWFVALVMAAAAVWDWRYRRIPNRLTFPFLIAGILYHLVYEGWSGAGKAAAGMFVAGGILLCFYLLGATGAGDVKLAAGLAHGAGRWRRFRYWRTLRWPAACLRCLRSATARCATVPGSR